MDPEDATQVLPYVVMLDAPIKRPVAVPADTNDFVRPEVCFGQNQDAALFTRDCLPPARAARPLLRFPLGGRVTCAVEDDSGAFVVWKAGTVGTLWARPSDSFEDVWQPDDAAAYAVDLDDGGHVLVHRDDQ